MTVKINVTPIIPDPDFFDTGRLFRELKNALDRTGNIIRDDFNRTVRTWRRKVKFFKIGPGFLSSDVLAVEVFTEDEIYFFVEAGTRAHIIRPRNASVLSFRGGYVAKTRPGIVGSRAGGARGPRAFARAVLHPGTQARNFAPTIAKRRQRNLNNLTRLAFNRSFRFGGQR